MANEPVAERLESTMGALRVRVEDGLERVRYERVPLPSPGIGDVLLEVHAASFTPTELGWPSTWADRAGNTRTAPIPAHEVSGVIAALGYGTTGLAVGDEAYGLTDWYRDGAAAGYVAVEARNLARKPASLDHVRSAAIPLAALTAWQALFDHAHLSAGQSVLIHGAGGGVGAFAVQLARGAGARVVATGRQWAEGPGGVLVSVVAPLAETGPRGASGVFFVVEPDRAALTELARLIDAGELRPVVGEVYPLERGQEAFEAKRRPGVPGKVVLRVAR
jgi:NADPH:quinone reductase-like Zn-dependent oxidoreductase